MLSPYLSLFQPAKQLRNEAKETKSSVPFSDEEGQHVKVTWNEEGEPALKVVRSGR